MKCLKNIKTGRIFPTTPELEKRADMRPCDCPGAKNKPAKPAKPEKKEPEPVDINTMDADRLEAFALEKFGVDIDKRHHLDDLRAEVQALIDAEGSEGEEKPLEQLHWTQLKKLVEERGGEWTNKEDAIAFLSQ